MATKQELDSGQNRVQRRLTRRSLGQRALGAGLALGLGGGAFARGAHAGQDAANLRFTFWGSTFEKRAMEEMAKALEVDKPQIEVDAQHLGDYAAYLTKMNTLIAANDTPDVAYMPEGLAFRLAEQGKLVDINDHFEQYPRLRERLPQSYYFYAPGKTFGTNTAVESMHLFYNKSLFEEAGVPLPPVDAVEAWTWDQFVQAAQALTIDGNGKRASEDGFDPTQIRQFGVAAPTGGASLYSLVRSNGGAITNEDGTAYALNSAEAVEVFQRIQDLIYTHHVAPTPTQQEANAATMAVQLQTKRIAMTIDGQWNLLDLGESKVNFGIGVLPKFKEPKTLIVGAPTVIFKSTRHPEAALEFYLYHNDPEAVDLFAKGLWMPLELKYYQDPAWTEKWIESGVHPPEYKQAVIDYVLNHGEPSHAYRLKNQDAIDPALGAGFDPIWTGEVPAQEALDELAGTIQPLLQGLYPAA